MSSHIYHYHHIIPKHAGGTDESSNLIKLTIEEHAEAHKKLWEKYNRWQDKIAFMSLSGMIGKEEIIHQINVLANIGNKNALGKKWSEETKEKFKSKRRMVKQPIGFRHSEETKNKLRILRYNQDSSKLKGWKHSQETKDKLKVLGFKMKNYMWYNDGIKETKILLGNFIHEGWNSGRIKGKKYKRKN